MCDWKEVSVASCGPLGKARSRRHLVGPGLLLSRLLAALAVFAHSPSSLLLSFFHSTQHSIVTDCYGYDLETHTESVSRVYSRPVCCHRLP